MMMTMIMMMTTTNRTITGAVTEVRSKFGVNAVVIMKMFIWRDSVYFGTFGRHGSSLLEGRESWVTYKTLPDPQIKAKRGRYSLFPALSNPLS